MSDDSDSSTENIISSEEEDDEDDGTERIISSEDEDDEDDDTERIISSEDEYSEDDGNENMILSEEEDFVNSADFASLASTNRNQQAEVEVIDISNSDDEEDPPHHREEQRRYRDCSLVCPKLLRQEKEKKDPQDPITAADWAEICYEKSSDEDEGDEGTFHQNNSNIYLPLNGAKSILS